MSALSNCINENFFHDPTSSIVKNVLSNFAKNFTIFTNNFCNISIRKKKPYEVVKKTGQNTLQIHYHTELHTTAVFEIADIDRAINSGFIEVPHIEDFDKFKDWFNSLK